MVEPLAPLLAGARARWMIGGDGTLPDHPLAAGQSAGEADLRLLAIAGQYQRFRQPPQPPALTQRPDLPPLTLPFVPEALRPLARRLLQDTADRAPLWLAIFVARRGYVLHPADWMPPPGADLPEVYRPLQLWQVGQSGQVVALTAETWLDYPKAERLALFAMLRKGNPAAARLLLGEHFAACPADERLALVEALATGLTEEDAVFLQGLASDRSDKVRKVVAHLLARLGQLEADPLAVEAAAMFEVVTEGFIRRRKVLRLNPKAKDGQLRSLVQTLPEISLQGLAGALGLNPAAFVALWEPEKVPQAVQHALSTMVGRTAAAPDVAAYWSKLRAQPDIARTCMADLFPRLSGDHQQAAILWLVGHAGFAACPDILALMGASVPVAVSAALTADRKTLIDLVHLSRDTTPERAARARADALRLTGILSYLGFLLTARDAALIVETVTQAGLHPADPQLDRLNFNSALKGP